MASPNPQDKEDRVRVRHYDYANGNGKPMRMTIKGEQREEIDVDLFTQALVMLVEQKKREMKGLPPEDEGSTIQRHE